MKKNNVLARGCYRFISVLSERVFRANLCSIGAANSGLLARIESAKIQKRASDKAKSLFNNIITLNLKQTLVLCTLLVAATPLHAQERGEWSMTVGADAASSYLWRGMNLAGPSLQPSAYVDYEKGEWAVSLGTWVSKSFVKGDYNEWDLSVEATWRNITFSLANYREYYGAAFDDNYLDLGISLTLSENIPVTFSWYSIINQYESAALIPSGYRWNEAFPSYFEVAYDFSLSAVDFTAAAGLLPFATDYYGNEEFGPCNLSLTAGHEFEFKHGGTLPISAQVMYNPMWRECFWGVSIGYYFSVDL